MRSILIPLDGSSFAQQAIPVALGIARQTGARIELVAVHELNPAARITEGTLSFDWKFSAALRRELGDYLERTRAAMLAKEPRVSIATALIEGPVTSTIVRRAQKTAADLIVLTTHGLSGPSRTWLGSVSDALLRLSEIPILAVRPDEIATNGLAPVEVHRVLIALDGTPESECAIEPALALSGTSDVEFVVVRVVIPLHPLLRTVGTEREYARDFAEQRALAQRYTSAVVGRLQARGLNARAKVPEDANAASAIIRVAREVDADVIALATHGRGPVGRMLLGSVADKVLRAAGTPVLLQRSSSSERLTDAELEEWDQRRAAVPNAVVPAND
ncbi:MAG: universal stress protein [Gemmatimonadota bacterium]